MRKRSLVPLALEQLEDRWVPATVQLTNGTLFISNPLIENGTTNLTLLRTSAGQFSVIDSGVNLGKYSVGDNVVVLGSNAKERILVEMNGNSYDGNLFVSSGNGNDTVTVNVLAAGDSTIGGNVTLLTGLGKDDVQMNSASPNALTVGGSLLASASGGPSTLQIGNGERPTTINGDVTVNGFADQGRTEAVTIGDGAADSIGGQLSVTNQSANNVSVMLGTELAGITVGNGLDVNTGAGNNTVTIEGDLPANRTTINGDTHLNLGDGIDFFDVAGDGNTAGGHSTVFNGNVYYKAGNGADSINLASEFPGLGAFGTTINGNLSIDLGDGNNFMGLVGFSGGLNFPVMTISGDLNVQAGNGNNQFDMGGQLGGTRTSHSATATTARLPPLLLWPSCLAARSICAPATGTMPST